MNTCEAENDNLRNRIRQLENENKRIRSELDQCQNGIHETVILRKELDSCREELSDMQISEEKLNQSLQTANQDILILKCEKEALKNQLNSLKQCPNIEYSEQTRLRQLENALDQWCWYGNFVNCKN